MGVRVVRGLEHLQHSLDKLFVTHHGGYLLLPQFHEFFGQVLVGVGLHVVRVCVVITRCKLQ
jgi:hypothetical protein